MTDSPTPRRRPQPSPRPAPQSQSEQTDGPTREPAPAPRSDAPPMRPARAARRREQRRADQQARQRRLRWVMIGGGVVAVLAAAASVVLAVSGNAARGGGTNTAASSRAAGQGARLTRPDVVTGFLAGASADIVAVTTYDYRRLDDALSAGLSVTTGTYREAFRQAMTGDVAVTARADRVVHDFEVLDLGIGQMSADGGRAKVLIFGRQISTDRTHRGGQATLVTLCATIVRQGDRYLIGDLQQDTVAGTPPGSPELAAAVEAGRAEVVNVLTYRRARFDADLRRALAGAVDPLRRELRLAADATRTAMDRGRYDLTGVVTATAVKAVSPRSVTLLVAAESSRLAPAGGQVTAVRYEVTVTYAGGAWSTSQINTLSAQ